MNHFHILLATHNIDKFRLTSRLLEIYSHSFLQTSSLKDIGIKLDPPETTPTVEQRAEEKVDAYLRCLETSHHFDAIMAVDVGISIGGGPISVESKKIAQELLSGKYPVGQDVYSHTAYSVYYMDTQNKKSVTVTLPYIYLGNPSNVSLQPNRYVLRHVLAQKGEHKPLSQLGDDHMVKNRLSYGKKEFDILFKHILTT